MTLLQRCLVIHTPFHSQDEEFTCKHCETTSRLLLKTSVANVRASEPASQTCEPCKANVQALRATEKHRQDRLCSLSFRSLASPLSRSEKYEIQTMGVMS